MEKIKAEDVKVVILETTLDTPDYYNCRDIRELSEFMKTRNAIIKNSWPDKLQDVADKIYTPDLFIKDRVS